MSKFDIVIVVISVFIVISPFIASFICRRFFGKNKNKKLATFEYTKDILDGALFNFAENVRKTINDRDNAFNKALSDIKVWFTERYAKSSERVHDVAKLMSEIENRLEERIKGLENEINNESCDAILKMDDDKTQERKEIKERHWPRAEINSMGYANLIRTKRVVDGMPVYNKDNRHIGWATTNKVVIEDNPLSLTVQNLDGSFSCFGFATGVDFSQDKEEDKKLPEPRVQIIQGRAILVGEGEIEEGLPVFKQGLSLGKVKKIYRTGNVGKVIGINVTNTPYYYEFLEN